MGFAPPFWLLSTYVGLRHPFFNITLPILEAVFRIGNVPLVNHSRHRNMKELRIQSKGDPLRAFYAFDPLRRGILLCAGNKVGNEKRFYEVMIPVADNEFTRHLNTIKEKELP